MKYILSWIKIGICVGPLLPIEDSTASALTTCLKPNGRVRLTFGLSFPHASDLKLGLGIPCSVNKGIETDKFKKQMSSTPLWLQFMRNDLLSKMD